MEHQFHYSRKLQKIRSFQAMELLAQARILENQGVDVVHMELGEPDFDVAEPIRISAEQSLRNKSLGYTPTAGIDELRKAVAVNYYGSHLGIDLNSERIIITTGASAALQIALTMVIDPGDEILITDPGYPCYSNLIRVSGGFPKTIPTRPETRFQFTPDLLRGHWSRTTKAALLSSPSNPTGTLIPGEHLKNMAEFSSQMGGVLIVDEIYQSLVYGEDPISYLNYDQTGFVINSFSKYFGMTGWRLGWLVVPEDAIQDAIKIQQNLYLSPPTLAQYVAIEALRPDNQAIFEDRRRELMKRRDCLYHGLIDLGFDCPVFPDGAFYLYANCERFGIDSHKFSDLLLKEAYVAVTPGTDFGNYGAEYYLRFSYTTPIDRIEIGLERLKNFIEKL